MRKQTVAVLGAGGTMGRGMAANIASAGMAVRAWNRTREKAEPLAGDGITVVDTPAEAADGADVVLTILSDGDAVLETIAAAAPAAGTLWLQMSTIGIEATARCAEQSERAGTTFVDAPVIGTKKPAEDGKLVVLASGPKDDRAEPIFSAVGQRTLRAGDEAGVASRLKLAVNVWIVSLVEGAAETLALAEGLGLDPQLILDAVEGGPLDLPYLQTKGAMMIERSFETSFSLKLAAKDAALAEDAAREHGLDLPLIDAVAERLAAGAAEHGDDDMAATFLTSATRQRPAAV